MKEEIDVIYDEWWKEGDEPYYPEQSKPDPEIFGYTKIWNEFKTIKQIEEKS